MLRRLLTVLGLLLFLGNVQIASAHDVLGGDDCTVAAGEKISGNVFALCRTLTVSGEIDGDLFGGASTIVIDGKVDGSLYLVGGELTISGTIGKDVHFAGGVLTLKQLSRLTDERSSVVSLNLSTEIDQARVPGSVTAVGYQLVIDGIVEREVSFWGSALTINNWIGGDVTATVGDPASTGVAELRTIFSFLPVSATLIDPGLRVTDNGMVNGLLRYSGPTAGEFAVTLPRPPEFTQVTSQADFPAPEKSFTENLRDYLAQTVRELISLALIGLVGLLLAPRSLQAPIVSLRVRPLPSLGVGLLMFIVSFTIFFIVVPLLGLVLVLLLFVLQLGDLALITGAIILVLDLGGAGLFYFTAIFISRVVVCIALGRFIVRLLFGERPERYMTYVSLASGVIVFSLLSSLPYVGFLLNAVGAFFGLGAILMTLQRQLEIARQANAVAPLPATYPEAARQLPPPVIEDKPRGPGMDNLPDGFHWWK